MSKITNQKIEQQEQQIRDRIRDERKKRGLSQEALAMEIGYSTTNYNYIENGINQLSSKHIFLIADALKIEPYSLFLPSDPNLHPINLQILDILRAIYHFLLGKRWGE